ncbi:transport protein particle component [Neohortaea acidophila]|uniref:Transport protein particle component n=1 Tax=Neohortaea acidophila TaxID=245834 RepID=A0A6A6PXY8_9PEZI|nr:transport protein particle component [Neohortaea acidophila]KAF2484604.1 transport protein particle component [Neohortaea acidophila]
MSKLSPSLDTDDAQNPKANAAALDFLLIELVPLAQRITEQVQAREKVLMEEYRRSKIFTNNTASSSSSDKTTSTSATDGADVASPPSAAKDTKAEVTSIGFPIVDEQAREGMFWRLDSLGYRVGQGLVERFSANKPRPQTPLDCIKFVCKDLWQLVFRKQIDNLKTNHRGIFVLTDQRFQALSRMSVDKRAGPKALEEALSRAQLSLYFPCGVIRGALAGLGITASVTAESTELPTATFQIKTKGANA